MATTTSELQTVHASRYLQQLCKHFGHKVPTRFTSSEGHISFPFGECDLQANEDLLTLSAKAEPSNLRKLERVLGDHLARFAFRESPTLAWQRTA